MNIIIPLGGLGTRFKKDYNVPKPLIYVFNKNIISYVIDKIMTHNNKIINVLIYVHF
jgi:NDP-sugar pyrophosphorylase family protein